MCVLLYIVLPESWSNQNSNHLLMIQLALDLTQTNFLTQFDTTGLEWTGLDYT